jgi:hypothetical protein
LNIQAESPGEEQGAMFTVRLPLQTIHYLGLALVAEEPTDYRFVLPILRHATEELCLNARSIVKIGDVWNLYPPQEYQDADFATHIR